MNTTTISPRVGQDGTTWFTSDTHFGHVNIIKYCDRPFRDTDHMDAVIIDRWNAVVMPEDTIYHLGDIALGNIDKGLSKITQLNGHKIAVLGNHDRPFMRAGKHDEEVWRKRYAEVFQEVWHWDGGTLDYNGQEFRLSHFPYTGDHTAKDRHADARPVDDGMPLIHGHTHTTDKLTYSTKGTPQVHVGQDAWGFAPVHIDQVISLLP